MRSIQLKNIVILLLIMMNLALLSLVISQKQENREYYRDNRANVLSILEKNGVKVSSEVIPWTETPAAATLKPGRDWKSSLAESLVGYAAGENAPSETEYLGERGSLSFFSDGSFFLCQTRDGTEGEQAQLQALQKALSLGALPPTLPEGQQLQLVPEVESFPVFNAACSLVFTENDLTVQGRQLWGSFQKSETGTMPPETLLLRFLSVLPASAGPCREILEITPGYWVGSDLSLVTTLSPVWEIRCDVGVFYLDCQRGTLNQLPQKET